MLCIRDTRGHLPAIIAAIEDEDDHNFVHDSMERIDGMIPNFEAQFEEYLNLAAASVDHVLIQASERELLPLNSTMPPALSFYFLFLAVAKPPAYAFLLSFPKRIRVFSALLPLLSQSRLA